MTFYTESYLVDHQHFNSLFNYAVIAILLIALIITLVVYSRHRLQTRYRDLSMIFVLILLFFTGLQVTNMEKSATTANQSSQMVPFIHAVAKDHHLKNSQVMVNSTTLTDGVIVRFNKKDYRVNMSPNSDNYTLERAHVVNHQVNVQR